MLKKFPVQPGVITTDTELAAKRYWTASDRIRFVRGLPEKLGGWTKFLTSTFVGIARGIISWLDQNSTAHIGLGTNEKLYAIDAGDFIDITPVQEEGDITAPFTTTAGSTSVLVHDVGHNLEVGQHVYFSSTAPIGGILISGEYTVTTVVGPDDYTITVPTSATSSAGPGGSLSAYSTSGVHFDGTNDYMLRGGDLTGNIDGSVGAASFWIRMTGGDGIPQRIYDNTGTTVRISRESTNRITVYVANAAGTIFFQMTSSSLFTAAQPWRHVAASWDTNHGAGLKIGQMFVDGLNDNPGFNDSGAAFTIDYTVGNHAIGATVAALLKLNADLADLYINFAEFIDLNTSIGTFVNPGPTARDLGAHGSIPTGNPPIILQFGPFGVFATNAGNGGNFSVTGTLTAATDDPPPTTGNTHFRYEIPIGRADAARGSGYGIGPYGLGTYGTARSSFIILPPRLWSLDVWGPWLVANPSGGSIYQWQLDELVRAQILPNAPTQVTGMFVTAEKIMVAYGVKPNQMEVDWSDQEDNTVWIASDQNTAGSRVLSGGSGLLFGLRTRGTNLLFADESVWAMTFIGGQDVFGFAQLAAGAAGIYGSRCAVDIQGVVFWMGDGEFFYYDGVVRPIPRSDDIREQFFAKINRDQRAKCWALEMTQSSEIFWFAPFDVEITHYVKFNYKSLVWDTGTMVRTAGMDQNIFGNPIMAAANHLLYRHEDGHDDDGQPMNEYIKAAPFDISDGEQFMDILGIIPDFKDLQGTIDITILTREYPASDEQIEAVVPVHQRTVREDFSAAGRQCSFRISSNLTNTHWRLGVVRMDVEPSGSR